VAGARRQGRASAAAKGETSECPQSTSRSSDRGGGRHGETTDVEAAVEQALAGEEDEQADGDHDAAATRTSKPMAITTLPATRKRATDGPEGQSIRLPLGVTTDWKSRWFDDRNYQDSVVEDWKVRDYLMTQLEAAA